MRARSPFLTSIFWMPPTGLPPTHADRLEGRLVVGRRRARPAPAAVVVSVAGTVVVVAGAAVVGVCAVFESSSASGDSSTNASTRTRIVATTTPMRAPVLMPAA